jgi:hypothetical protein
MARINPTAPTAPPTPAIQRGDRTTFSARVDATITYLTGAPAEIYGLATATYTNALDAYDSATLAKASSDIAVAAVNTTAWVSGTAYTAGQVRYSPTNGRTFRRLTNGDGTTDPGSDPARTSADPTNWVLLSQRGVTPLFHVREEVPSSNAPLSSAVANTYVTRGLNTVKNNTITGASLASNQVTLPAGVYRFDIRAPAVGINGRHRVALYNVTDGTYVLVGQNTSSSTNLIYTTASRVAGQFTISTPKVFEVRHYANASGSFGEAISQAGQAEVYLDAQFWKED